jgi:RimJ/RimL family protein N-acetyltransferase
MNISDNLFAGKRVRLAAPKPDDHEIMARWTNHSEYWRMLDSDPARPQGPGYFADEDKDNKDKHRVFAFRVRTLDDDKLIGFTDLYVSWNNQTCWLAVGIGEPDYWGKGYGGEVIGLMLNYAFRELNLYRVGLNVFGYNTRAIRAYEKAGFVHEGRTRAMLYRDGQRHDMIYMSVLRPEWEARLDANAHTPR